MFVPGFSLPGAVTARRSGRVWLGFMRMVTIDRIVLECAYTEPACRVGMQMTCNSGVRS